MSLDDPIVAAVLADLAPAVQPAPATAGLPSRFACFVTGTDTEIGKTLTSSALLHALGQKGPAEIEPKRQWTFRQVAWAAHQLNIPLQVPAQHPFNPLPLLRLAWASAPAGGTPNRLAVE